MFINGTYNILLIEWDGEFLPVGCLTSNGFSEDVEQLDATTRDNNNGWRTYTLTNQGYSISFSGLVINTNFTAGDFEKISYDRLKVLKRNRTLINWKIQTTDLLFVDSGQGYITELSNSSNVDEFISFEGSILGYGEPASTTEKPFIIQDGNDNNIQDGNNNNIVTA